MKHFIYVTFYFSKMRHFTIAAVVCLSLVLNGVFVFGLECYSGYSVIRGQSVGTSTEVCKKDTDQCYKASAEASPIAKLKMAGCSTVRCMVGEKNIRI